MHTLPPHPRPGQPTRARFRFRQPDLGPSWRELDRRLAAGTALAGDSTRHKMLNEATLRRRLSQLQEAVRADQPPPSAPAPAPAACSPPAEAPAAPLAPAWMARTAGGRSGQLRRYQAAG